MEQTPQASPMGSVPVKKLMIKMGLPMICSMILQAVYNIVDSAFVSNMAENGEEALNALTLAFPMQVLLIAIGIGTGVGANVLLSKRLGQGNREGASRVAGNGIFLMCVIYVAFLLFGLFGVPVYIRSQTGNPIIYQMGVEYLRICMTVSAGVLCFNLFEKLLQATGRSLYSTIAQVVGAVANIILDPILIYGLLGLPAMGVRGAAYATIIGQILSGVAGLAFHLKLNKEVDNGLRYVKPSPRVIRDIYSIGLPAIIAQALMSVMTYGLNLILVRVGENMVTAYGLYYKIQQFVLFAAFGLRDAITPILSFAHGMGSRSRVKDGIKYGMMDTLTIMVVGIVLVEALATPFSRVFGLSGQTQALCVSAMRIISLSFLFAGANIAFQGIFQALDGGLESLILSLCRQLIFILPVAALFTRLVLMGAAGSWLVWLTFPIGEGISTLVALGLMQRTKKKIAALSQ